MAEQRQEKIKTLRRQEDRNKKLPALLKELSSIASRPFSENDVLTLEQIDRHRIQVNSSDFDFNFLNLSFPVSRLTELLNVLTVLSDVMNQPNYFALNHFSDIAVFKIKTDFVINSLEKIIKLDKDTFIIYDRNCKNGFWIDLFQEYWHLDSKTQRIWIYELRVFGKDWIKLVSDRL